MDASYFIGVGREALWVLALATLPILPFVPLPGPSVWPWIVASVIIHIGYRLFLIRAYEHGDLAQAYPLARGTAPLITAIGGIFMLSEVPSHLALVGILLLSLAFASGVMAEGTGPTQPDKARQHPLDNSEPRDEPAEQPRQQQQLDQPPTLQPRQSPIETDVPPQLDPVDEQPGSDVDAAGPRVLRS